MFVLLILAVMLAFGAFLQNRISVFYHNNFRSAMTLAFSRELTNKLEEAVRTGDGLNALTQELATYSGRMGISSDRSYYILSRRTGEFLAGSDNVTDLEIERTDNILAAMAGKAGDKVEPYRDYLDYAVVAGEEYIVYVRDNKEQMLELIRAIYSILAQALIAGILISMILGFFLSRTITRPISNLTRKAASLARGNFDTKIDLKANDEIGTLASTFNHMTAMVKSSMEEIAKEKNKLETMFRYMTDGIMAFDINQRAMHINPAAKEMLGIEDDGEGIAFDSYFETLNADICMAQMLYIDQQATVERRVDVGGKNFKAYFATFEVAEDKLSGVIVVLQDITEAQRLDMSRREFVANVSHELRTPLTTIKSYAETLLDTAPDGEERRFLDVINREVDRMTRIVKDLLTLSSLDNQKLVLSFQNFSLEELLRDITAKMSIEAKNHKHEMVFFPSTAIPDLYGDRDRLEQVVTNILSNALKYTPDGGKIEVYAGYLYNEAYIKIKDNGIGIKQQDLPRVFERFYRADKARSRERGGTGLGLAIARNFIELHGGTIKIDSEYGKGTEVLIKLPVKTSSEP
jgi:two-component system sensor histidine kinase VicK